LISLLVLGSEQQLICDLKKGAIAALSRPPGGGDLYDLAWIATPRLLRRLGAAPND
jgi:hypothetical protein